MSREDPGQPKNTLSRCAVQIVRQLLRELPRMQHLVNVAIAWIWSNTDSRAQPPLQVVEHGSGASGSNVATQILDDHSSRLKIAVPEA